MKLVTSENTAYLELPPESKYRMAHAAGDHPKSTEAPGLRQHHSISTDSLLFNDNKEDDITDVDGCFEMQCHQVFIGMVTMQYQAQTDIVQLIERLDRACIRFVHFSKENELRSRVFSEKMGLESGWNCHISLLSKSTRYTRDTFVWVSLINFFFYFFFFNFIAPYRRQRVHAMIVNRMRMC